MELTTTIKKLEEIKKELDKSGDYLITLEVKKLDLIIHDLKLDLLNASTTGTLNKARNKKLSAWHKKQLKSCRPVLAYSTIYNNYQVFTNSYFMVALADPDKTELIPDISTAKNRQYPVVNQLINNAILYLKDKKITLDIEKITAMLKLHEKVYIQLFDNIIHVINKEAFNNLITFLNISSNADIKTISFNKSILYIESITGSIGFIQSCRNDNKATADNTIQADA